MSECNDPAECTKDLPCYNCLSNEMKVLEIQFGKVIGWFATYGQVFECEDKNASLGFCMYCELKEILEYTDDLKEG